MSKPNVDDLQGFPGDEEYDEELAKLLAQPEPEGWRPAVGDTITGTVIEMDTATSEYGPYPLLTVEKPNGQLVALHCFHTMLKNRVERNAKSGRLREGSRIGITYQGQAEGADFHRYRVVILPARGDTTEF